MPQNNPLNRYRRDADSVTSPPVSEPTAPQADVPTSSNGSTSARKQEDKPTKSYRLDRELAFQFMLWARSRHLTESAAIERAIRLLMSQED